MESDHIDDSDADPNYEPQSNSSSDDELPSKRKRDDCPNTSRFVVQQQGENNIEPSKRNIRARGRNALKGDTRAVRKDRKLKRNLGKAYVSINGKAVANRETQPLTSCRMKCQHKFSNEARESIFKEYWSMGSRDKRVAYIAGLITAYDKQISRKKVEDESKQKKPIAKL